MNFIKDKSVGDLGEKLVLHLMWRLDINATIVNDVPYYDILCFLDKQPFTIEVKHDIYSEKSGNIAIEYFNPKSNKPAGISITGANLWAHVTPNEVWMASVKLLKIFLQNNQPFRTVESGGDNNASIYLYKKSFIMPSIFQRFDILEKHKAISIMKEWL